jgi:hypothetical protein
MNGSTPVVALLASVVLGQATQEPKPPVGKPGGTPGVTVSGCLKAGDASGEYVLTNLRWSDKSGAGTTAGATGTSASATSPGSARGDRIALTEGPSVKLRDHVGHAVELSGVLSPSTAAASASGTSGTAAAAGGKKASETLQVGSIKMVSATCQVP